MAHRRALRWKAMRSEQKKSAKYEILFPWIIREPTEMWPIKGLALIPNPKNVAFYFANTERKRYDDFYTKTACSND